MTGLPGEIPVVSEVVERLYEKDVGVDVIAGARNSLRPIQAVVGRPFPCVLSDCFYGNCPGYGSVYNQEDSRRGGHSVTMANGSANRFTAHVQPQGGNCGEGSTDLSCVVVHRGGGVLASIAQQHQWEAKDFDDLENGYYSVPLRLFSADAAQTTESSVGIVQGEAYLELVLRFLRSTVRKHRDCAIEALHARLIVDTKLRERCAFGPGCAQLIRFIIVELSACRAVTSCNAAKCLVLLFWDVSREVIEAVAEIGVPQTDPAARAGSDLAAATTADSVDDDATRGDAATFAEISEWMRGGEDKALALDQLGLTTAVIDALDVLPPPLAAALLLGSGVLCLPSVTLRVASDPRYVRLVRRRIGDVVMGGTQLGEIAEELLLLRRVLHVKEACRKLRLLLHEPFVLFFRHICAMSIEGVGTLSEVVARLAAFSALRAFMRHGFFGVFYDISDALLAAVGVGAFIPTEIWFILTATNSPATQAPSATRAFGAEFAHGAVHLLKRYYEAVEECDLVDETSAVNCALLLAVLSSMHYLATYFTLNGPSEETQLLLGSANETMQCVRELMIKCILSSKGLRRVFLRLTDERPNGGTFLTVDSEQQIDTVNAKEFVEACWASLTHARVRLVIAVDIAFSAFCMNESMAFFASMATNFEQRCVSLKQVTTNLLPDELCTMVELVGFMRDRMHTAGSEQRLRYLQDTYTAEIFVLHGIATTKHCLDAAPKLITSVLGLLEYVGPDAVSGSLVSSQQLCSLFALEKSLRRGVEQTEWPWFVFSLYDGEFVGKSAWFVWIKHVLEVHEYMKRLLEWEVILFHALKWAVLHRGAERNWRTGNDKEECVTDNECTCDNGNLLELLEKLCCDVLPRSASQISTYLSYMLKMLTASVLPQTEEPMNIHLFGFFAVTATVCEPSTAIAIVSFLSHTVVYEDKTQRVEPSVDATRGPATSATATITAVDDGCGVATSFSPSFTPAGILRRWAATGLLGDDVSSQDVVSWDLENFVGLLHAVVGRHDSSACDWDVNPIAILHQLVEGVGLVYLRQHSPLSVFELRVLSRAVGEDGAWCPLSLREVLGDKIGA